MEIGSRYCFKNVISFWIILGDLDFMKFYVDRNNLNKNTIVLHDDKSFGYDELKESWDCQIALNDSIQFILNIDSKSNKCTSCEGYIIQTKHVQLVELEIPKSELGGLFVENILLEIANNGHANNFRTLSYEMKNKNLYLDMKNKLFAIGNLNAGNFYQFGRGQFVSLSNNGELNCIIIHFEN